MNVKPSLLRLSAGLFMTGLPTAWAEKAEQEWNLWPFYESHRETDGRRREQAFGPLAFAEESREGHKVSGVRPFFYETHSPVGNTREFGFLYPFFVRREQSYRETWSLLGLVQGTKPRPAPLPGEPRRLELWPFYLEAENGRPDESYRAFFPFHGTLKGRFYNDRVDFTLFPLYGRFQSGEKVVRTLPWPFVRVIEGGGHRGFALWPLGGWREEAGRSRSHYLLWPLIHREHSRLDEPIPTIREAFLPFYAREQSAEHKSETYLWPFFGYTERKAPQPYTEKRYLWPLVVRGHGTVEQRERWAPFYTHSVHKGVDKTWVLWPLWRHATWTEAGLRTEKSQVLYFVASSQSWTPVAGGNSANRSHLWPLASAWEDGTGRRQLQVFSPLEPLMPKNSGLRHTWAPLFALYRYNAEPDGSSRHALLWNAASYAEDKRKGRSSLTLGPLFTSSKTPDERRVALLGGLFSLRLQKGRWRFLLGDFQASEPRPSLQP